MTTEEALVHFLNDSEYKWMRLWTEIVYALQEGHNPSREEMADFVRRSGTVWHTWQRGLAERHEQPH